MTRWSPSPRTRRAAARLRLVALAIALAGAACPPAIAQDASPTRSLADGRLGIGAAVSGSITSHADDAAWFNYADYSQNVLRLFRVALSAEWRPASRLSVLAEVRTENDHHPRLQALYVRVRPLARVPLDVQAGRIPPVFGAFARRDYATGNPLIGYPLAYQYLTSIRHDALPVSPTDLFAMRARGWLPSYPLGSQRLEAGVPLVSSTRWDTGVQLHAGTDRLSAGVAVTQGTLAYPATDDGNGGRQVAGRVQWHPLPALVVGASAARGAFFTDAVTSAVTSATGSLPAGQTGRGTRQDAIGIDAELSRDQWVVRGELISSRWQMPTLATPLRATAGFIEGRYKLLPGLFVASRFDRLGFSRLTGEGAPTVAGGGSGYGGDGAVLTMLPWDAPVTRAETGVGYYVRPNWLAKVSWQRNWRDAGLVRQNSLLAAQIQGWLR